MSCKITKLYFYPDHQDWVEVYLGTCWHFLGFNKNMCKSRRIDLRYDVLTYPGISIEPTLKIIIGVELYGRDPSKDIHIQPKLILEETNKLKEYLF